MYVKVVKLVFKGQELSFGSIDHFGDVDFFVDLTLPKCIAVYNLSVSIFNIQDNDHKLQNFLRTTNSGAAIQHWLV